MLVEEVRFMARQRRRNIQWDVIILVDQSGSMAGSVLHSAVSAAILAGLPGLSVRLVLFDTGLADLSHLAQDPVEVLMSSQLGGGTDIAKAMHYAETLVSQPSRTVLALISDFEEGGSVSSLLACTRHSSRPVALSSAITRPFAVPTSTRSPPTPTPPEMSVSTSVFHKRLPVVASIDCTLPLAEAAKIASPYNAG